MEESRYKWFGLVQRRDSKDVSKWRMKLNIPGGMSRRGPKRKVMDVGGWCERGGWRG